MKKIFLFLITTITFFRLSADAHKKLLIFCEIREKDIGGVEKVVGQLMKRLPERNYTIKLMAATEVPELTSPYVTYPWKVSAKIADTIRTFQPDHILVIYHGMMSYQAAFYCAHNNIPFTIFYGWRAPDLLGALTGYPRWMIRCFINQFLSKASNILVPSASLRDELIKENLKNIIVWPHGIDLDTFTLTTQETKKAARKACNLENYPAPFYLYVGRISPEKNIPTFLDAQIPGTKIVVGPALNGLSLKSLRKKYPHIIFPGPQEGKKLLNYYASADIFFFPSKIDTFGLVLLEALATGLPVVGFNTVGPKDVVPQGSGVSYLARSNKGIEKCALEAWNDVQANKVTREQCRAHAQKFSWDAAMDLFEQSLIQIHR